MRAFGHLRYSIGSESLKYTYLSFARNAMIRRRARDKDVEEHIRDWVRKPISLQLCLVGR